MALGVALLALPLPMVTLHSCEGESDAYSGLEWVVLGMPPLSLVPLGVMGLLAYWAFRRRPAELDERVLGAAFRYAGATLGLFLTVVLPAVKGMFGTVEWRLGGWVHLGGWVVATVAAAVAALGPVLAEGPDLSPRLRRHSLVLRWAVVTAVPVVALVGLPFALSPGLEGESNPMREVVVGTLAAWVVLVAPGFTLLRALEARLRAGRRFAVATIRLALALAWAGLLLGGVGGVVNVIDAAEGE